jgi:multidrug resistance efflux pump
VRTESFWRLTSKMAKLFRLSSQQFARDRTRLQASLLSLPVILMALWCAWMYLAHVSVYATTDQARIEVAQTAFIVQAPVSGRVVLSHLSLGDRVTRGSVLVELEAEPEQLLVDQEKSHKETLETQIASLHRQISTEQATLVSERGAADAATQEARANLAKAEEAATFSKKESDQKVLLLADGLTSKLDAERFASEYKERSSELAAARQAVARAERQTAMQGGERLVRIEALQKEMAEVQGELAASGTTQERLEHELGAHQIVASGDGLLGEVAPLRAGSFVREGDRLAAIVPDGGLRVVASFPPSEAIGRVRKGQKAWLRLDGFPSAEYGPIIAHVVGVGSEVRDGRVRVELAIEPNARVPLQHGLPGTLEVEVDRVTPASYLLRKAGAYLAGAAGAQPTETGETPAQLASSK